METPPTLQEVVAKVCCIPEDFHKQGDVSVVYLLEKSGYGAVRLEVTVSVIRAHLQAHPQLIDVWHGYSGDQRTDRGWYFDGDRSETGYFASGGRSQVETHRDRAQACALYIKRELEAIRENPSFGSGMKSAKAVRKKGRTG